MNDTIDIFSSTAAIDAQRAIHGAENSRARSDA
jgi:hypothetical protein